MIETLRTITCDYQDVLYEAVNCEEISDETFEKLKYLNEKFDKKIENLAFVVKEIDIKAEAIKNEVKRLQNRLEIMEKNSNRIKNYMVCEMTEIDKPKIETPLFTISLRKSDPVDVDDKFIEEAKEKHLEKLFRIIPERIEPDKTAIKEYINSGQTLKYARILEKQNLNIK